MTTQRKVSPIGFLDGGGQMGALMRSYDWSRTPLGDPAEWPGTLKAAVATCLSSRFPMVIWWGPQLLMLYNDAWQPILGDAKHPVGLGRPGAESWRETWPVVGVQFESALKGIASWSEDLLLASDRHGFLEESYFTYSHGPLRDISGEIVGVLSVVSETTARVLNERRLRTLATLSTAAIDATRRFESTADTCQLLVDTLCQSNPDIPFAVQYLVAPAQLAKRMAVAGIDAALLPQRIESTDQDTWGISETIRCPSRAASKRVATGPLPGGVWPEATREVLALPLLRSTNEADLCGVLVVGLNSRLHLDTPYLEFLGLVAAQFGSAISALQSVQTERAARADAENAARLRAQQNQELDLLVQMRTQELAALSSHLQNLAEREKSAIARELHDELGGIMVAAKMDVAWLERHVQPTDELKPRWERLRKLLDDGVEMKRRVVETLRPTLLDNLGLIPAVKWLYAEICARAGLTCSQTYSHEDLRLSDEAGIAVFRIVQESLTNIVKHAEASEVSISMTVEADSLKIIIRDNGIGIRSSGNALQTHGLASMRHRVTSLGGTWQTSTPSGGGTEIEVSLPMDRILASSAIDNGAG